MKDWANLYHAVNLLMTQLMVDGEIRSGDEVVNAVMIALCEIDGGIYDKNMDANLALRQGQKKALEAFEKYRESGR